MENEEAKRVIDYRDGELIGLAAAVRALILCHPHPQQAYDAVRNQFEKLIANSIANDTTSDPMIQGIQRTKAGVLPTLDQLAQALRDAP